jgi:hypothetical protein
VLDELTRFRARGFNPEVACAMLLRVAQKDARIIPPNQPELVDGLN